MKNTELYNRIYAKYGYDAMLNKWIEELLELATLLQQSKSKVITSDDLVKEVSDVSIIIEQIACIHDIEGRVVDSRESILKHLPDKLDLV
jgi:NTP pyrophosphatase (non-canonical NTP hydrolase)|tara:strand:+ start:185 stop:454 length:270 start_codon:yes stop_codon:yes gene_type:complete